MVINFYIKYKTAFGQDIVIHIDDRETQPYILPLKYLNEEYWFAKFDTAVLNNDNELNYCFFLREDGKADIPDMAPRRHIALKKLEEKEINVFDDWKDQGYLDRVFETKPFQTVFNTGKFKIKDSDSKKASHIFQVEAPYLADGKFLCITGEGKKLNNWDKQDPLILKKRKGVWSIRLNLNKESFPFQYKFGVFDALANEITHFESGDNRILHHDGSKDRLNILHQFAYFEADGWRAAGVNVQLSSLKSEQSWGIGDFTDLNLLTDWSKSAGIKMIQLLPINDTTASHDKRDSYPYSAISAFALHPIFLNVQKLALALALEFPDEVTDEIHQLNAKPSLDYERVWQIKRAAIEELYEKDRLAFKDDFAFFDFFDLHRSWLTPYAVFCCLRDKNNTADFTEWPELNIYDEDAVQEFASPDQQHYDQVAIHYFTQFHLHLQLLDAVEYAHKNGVILKGDLPIGVGRFSVDTWMHPGLFHMDMQAGAPPDAFAVKGQNWGFPTYNWEAMRHNGYAWWRQRMEYMSNYFDAIRVDHVLGFFRIWSIPLHASDGIFGHFEPSHSLTAEDFRISGLHFNEDKLCRPFVSEHQLHSLFGSQAGWVREQLLDGNYVKPAFSTQKKMRRFLEQHPNAEGITQSLLDLLSDVILHKDETNAGRYHFRIGMQMTDAYKGFSGHEQHLLNELYRKYFFETQNELWYQSAQGKLDAIQKSSDMLVCAEDLGMVPEMVEDVLKTREILALQVQRMPKVSTEQFSHPANAPYMCVVTPSTHDMGTMREWWEEDRSSIQHYYNHFLGQHGSAPTYCEPWIATEIVTRHLASPAMWSVFLLQDLLALSPELRRENPREERINYPADPNHYWNYRMHLTLQQLSGNAEFTETLRTMIANADR